MNTKEWEQLFQKSLADILQVFLLLGFLPNAATALRLALETLPSNADTPRGKPSSIGLGGLWAGHRITNEDISTAKKEMWGNFGELNQS